MRAREYKFDVKRKLRVNELGAFRANSVIRFALELSDDARIAVHSAAMVIHRDAWNTGNTTYEAFALEEQPGDGTTALYSLTLDFEKDIDPENGEGLYYYHYAVQLADGSCFVIGGEKPVELDFLSHYVGERQLLLYRPDFTVSRRFKEGTVYHIFVDRFARSGKCPVKQGAVYDPDWENGTPQYAEYQGADVANNVFFGGDLYGVTQKLDYIASLGVRTIYLSPIFDAASNHKYDTGDYLSVDVMFGGDDALEELCREAKKRDIDILLDGVFNHTGADSIYFNKFGHYDSVGAYQSKESKWADWYEFQEFPERYTCWWGVKTLPRVSSEMEDYRQFICGEVVKKWMVLGVGGWRLDVADELSDSFLDDFREAVKEEDPDAVLLGEVWEDASDKISYGRRRRYLTGSQLDSVMNYPLRSGLISYILRGETEELRHATEGLYRRYPKETSDNLLNFLGTHDTERILTLFGGEEAGSKSNAELAALRLTDEERARAKKLVGLAYGILAGLPGVPCVFYGDEVGMEGYRDPFCRRPFPWHAMDSDLLRVYCSVGRARKSLPAFYDGGFRILSLTAFCFIYLRETERGESVLAAACKTGSLTLVFPTPVREYLSGSSDDIFRLRENEFGYFLIPQGMNPDRIKWKAEP
ncbi:MAG: glycoside hydrolase family 13 protein [Clostridia bacterium]|nr:glycoside hydrolase family 13 protein [Clostridia bacterium]